VGVLAGTGVFVAIRATVAVGAGVLVGARVFVGTAVGDGRGVNVEVGGGRRIENQVRSRIEVVAVRTRTVTATSTLPNDVSGWRTICDRPSQFVLGMIKVS
jgi:hypothetical protein